MKIKPCPFCGSEAKLKVTEDNSDYCYENGKILEYYDIQCTNKECYLCDGADWNLRNREDIIKMWNTRNKQKEREDKLNKLGI